MSYDIGMTIDAGGPEPITAQESINMTGNLSPMWHRAMKFANGIEDGPFRGRPDGGWGLRWLDGRTGQEAIPKLEAAACWMADNAEELKKLNPANGWGDFDAAILYVRQLIEMAKRAPKATFYVSC